MASNCALHAHPGTFFVKILEQMSVVTLQIIFWAQLPKALCFLMLLSRTISTLTFFPANPTEERKEQVRITRGNSFIPGPCLWDEERGLGRTSILSVMPNAAPDKRYFYHSGKSNYQNKTCSKCFYQLGNYKGLRSCVPGTRDRVYKYSIYIIYSIYIVYKYILYVHTLTGIHWK